MSKILKLRNKPGSIVERRYVGVNIPPDLFLYIQLQTAATGNTKSCFIKELVKEQSKKVSSDSLIEQIVERTNKSWKNLKATTTFEQFLLDLKNDFDHLHIPMYYQEVIVTQIQP